MSWEIHVWLMQWSRVWLWKVLFVIFKDTNLKFLLQNEYCHWGPISSISILMQKGNCFYFILFCHCSPIFLAFKIQIMEKTITLNGIGQLVPTRVPKLSIVCSLYLVLALSRDQVVVPSDKPAVLHLGVDKLIAVYNCKCIVHVKVVK